LNLLIGYILYVYEYTIKLIIFKNYKKLSCILFVFMYFICFYENFIIDRGRSNTDIPKF